MITQHIRWLGGFFLAPLAAWMQDGQVIQHMHLKPRQRQFKFDPLIDGIAEVKLIHLRY